MTSKSEFLIAITAALLASVTPLCAQRGPSGYNVVDRIPGADGGWDFANLDSDRGLLYVAHGDAITKVDLATKKVTDRLAPARHAHQVLVIDGGATVFETDGDTGLGRFVRATDGAILAEIKTGAKPDAAFLDPKTGLIAVMNAGDGQVVLIDPRTRALVGSIDVGGALEFGVADGRGGGFVNIEDKAEIARIDLVSRKRTGTLPLQGCEGPTGLGLVNGGRRLIVACVNRKALVVDPVSGRTVATLPIGTDPDAVLVDDARGLAFIPCGGTGTLVALATRDLVHMRVRQVIPTQVGAKTGAVDPRSGRIYLPAAKLAAPRPGAKRGEPIAGTFAILVVALPAPIKS